MMKTAKTVRTVLLATLGWSVAGCSELGPDRDPPHMPVTEHYAATPGSQPLPEADGVRQQLDVGARPVPPWWKAYGSEELDGLVDEGLANSPSLAAAQNALKSAHEALRSQIGATLVPRFDLGFGAGRLRTPILPILPQVPLIESLFVGGVQTTYTFNFFGAERLGVRAAARRYQEQAFQFEATRRALAGNIVLATINTASLQEQLAATQRLVDLGEERASITKQRYELGSASRADMLATEEEAANLASSLPPLREQLLAVRHAQAILLGRTPDKAPQPMPLEALHLPEHVPLALSTDLLHQRPDILAAEAAVRASAEAAGAAAAALFPSLNLTASYGQGGFDWSSFTSPGSVIWSVGALITQPLFHGGELVARKHQYEAAYDAAVAQYKQTVLSAFANVADTLVSLEEDANALAQAQRAQRAAQAQHENIGGRYELGSAPLSARLTVDEQLQTANVQLTRARALRLADTANLFQAMGNPPVAGPDENFPDTMQMLMGSENQ